MFMHSSFRSLLGIAFDVLAQGGRSRSINLAVKLGAKNMHETYSCLVTFAWMNKIPMTVFFLGVPGCGRDTSRIFADMEQKFLSAT